MYKKAVIYLGIGTGILIFLSFRTNSAVYDKQHVASTTDTAIVGKWFAPLEADTIKNPYPFDSLTVAKGADTYELYCKLCHGDAGYGDGPAGAAMDIKPANFHLKELQDQKDGVLFWKLTNGRGMMAPYKEILTVEQRWQLVNFIRELPKEE